jgi:flagellar basal body-associated protein FliL
MKEEGDIMDFYVNGNVAPGGRFKYRYSTVKYKSNSFNTWKLVLIVVLLLATVGLTFAFGLSKRKKRGGALERSDRDL